MMQNIPEKGRYDFTLEKIGQTKEGVPISRWIIDNGRFKGKRVTVYLKDLPFLPEKGIRKSAKLNVIKFAYVDGSYRVFTKKMPPNTEKIRIQYRLTDFDKAENESTIKITKQKFKR